MDKDIQAAAKGIAQQINRLSTGLVTSISQEDLEAVLKHGYLIERLTEGLLRVLSIPLLRHTGE